MRQKTGVIYLYPTSTAWEGEGTTWPTRRPPAAGVPAPAPWQTGGGAGAQEDFLAPGESWESWQQVKV